MSREEALELLILDAMRSNLPELKSTKYSPVRFKLGTAKAVFVKEDGREEKRFTSAQKAIDYAVGRLMNP